MACRSSRSDGSCGCRRRRSCASRALKTTGTPRMASDAIPSSVMVLHGGAHELARHIGPDGFHVLRELVVSSRWSRTDAVVTVGCRELGRRLGLSKDTVNRRINDLLRLGVLECLGAAGPSERFARRSYRLRLDLAGIEVVALLRVPSAGGIPAVVEPTNGS